MRRMIRIIATTILLTLLLGLNTYASNGNPEYEQYIDDLCEYTYTDIDPSIVKAIIFYESSWQRAAVSSSGTHVGLMQVSLGHKSRMKELGVTDLTNGYQNILVGIDLLDEYREMYQEPCKVLDAYNGQLHSDEWYEAGNMSNYSKKVLKLAEELDTK